LDYRNLVEQLIARTAAERRQRSDIVAMTDALDSYRRATSVHESRIADHWLHDAVATATKNPYLRRLSRALISATNLGFRQDPFSQTLRQHALLDHEKLVDAIVRRDGEEAAQVAKDHFLSTSSAPWKEFVTNVCDGESIDSQ